MTDATTAPTEDKHAHAKANAQGVMNRLSAAMAALEVLDTAEGAASVEYDGDTFTDVDDLRERLREEPLSVQVRSGWYQPGGETTDPEEFEVLLTTGGPALRIIGDLDSYSEPTNPRLQWQDWFVPWTDFPTSFEEDKALAAFCGLFYFGGG